VIHIAHRKWSIQISMII